MFHNPTLGFALTGLLFLGSTVQAQTSRRVPADVTCSSCRIQVVRTALLGNMNDAEILGELIGGVAQTRNGFLVAGASGGTNVLQYGRDGRLQRLIGQPGSGPGELDYVTSVLALAGDSVVAIQRGRVTIFGPDGTFARAASTPRLTSPMYLRPAHENTWLYSRWLTSPGASGFQYHVFSADFQLLRSFGPVPADHARDCVSCAGYATSPSNARPRHFWALPPNQYAIDLWHHSGTHIERIAVSSNWFRPWNSDVVPRQSGAPLNPNRRVTPPQTPPRPRLSRIWEDADGLLWITGHIASRQWRSVDPGPAGRSRTGDELWSMLEQSRRNFDTIIEVVDPRRGVIIARHTVAAEGLVGFAPGFYWSIVQDGRTGLVQIQIWSATLTGYRPGA